MYNYYNLLMFINLEQSYPFKSRRMLKLPRLHVFLRQKTLRLQAIRYSFVRAYARDRSCEREGNRTGERES